MANTSKDCSSLFYGENMQNSKKSAKKVKKSKIFVLDTNVFLYDPTSFFRFDTHDIFIPMATLEELDNNKNGTSEVSRNGRQASRYLDEIINGVGNIDVGFNLKTANGGSAKGKLFLQSSKYDDSQLPFNIPSHKADNEILRVTIGLKNQFPEKEVILVSKDINLRIKAVALKVLAEDYWNDRVVEDADLLYTGRYELPETFWDGVDNVDGKKNGTSDHIIAHGIKSNKFIPNMLVTGNGNLNDFSAIVENFENNCLKLKTLTDYQHQKNSVWGICAKNTEQSFALNLLLDPEIEIVSILGQAGSGKTLLTLAASLDLLFNQNKHTEMIFTRITVPVGEEIGFLPGTEEDKMMPWMGALDDNLDVLTQVGHGERLLQKIF